MSLRLTLVVSLAAAASLAWAGPPSAPPSLQERIREANVWHRLARDGKARYFMIGQPSQSEVERARELGLLPRPLDGGRIALGRSIEFREAADLAVVSAFGAGVKNRRVEKNALAFEVGADDAWLAWGNFEGKAPKAGYLPFGVAYEWQRNDRWYAHTFSMTGPFGIYLRVRQSARESTWKVVTGPNPEINEVKAGAAPGGFTAEFKVSGTDWQTIPLIYGDKVRDPKGKPATFLPFGSFAIYPGDPGNQVEIAWVRVTDPGNHIFARRTVNLPAPARTARMTLGSWDAEVYVNGRRVSGRWVPYSSMGPRIIELAPFLKPGRNVIALHALNNYAEVTTTGGITCADGTFVPLFSWLPMKQGKGKWVLDESVRHFSLGSPHAGPWKSATLAFRPEDTGRFMQPDYDDRDWGELTALETSGSPMTATPYFGLLHVEPPPPEKIISRGADLNRPRLHPIFSVREPVRLMIQALHTQPKHPAQRIAYVLMDQQTGKELARGDLPLDASSSSVFERKGLPAGAYELRLRLEEDGRQVDERAFEFLVVGQIAQPVAEGDDILEGLKLKQVVDIDCAAAPAADSYGAFLGWEGKGAPYEAKVVAAPFGKFRETGPNNADCFSYKVKIDNPRKPHILEVTYPDDRFRVHGFFYTETRMQDGLSVGVNRCSVAVMSGWPEPPSQTFKVARGLFWPVGTVGTVDVYTTRYDNKFPACPAAAARIRIFEVDGEVPRAQVHDFPGQFKPLGMHTERGSYVLWPSYYAGRNNPGEASSHTLHERPDFYADWYSTTTNFVRGLRFHGLNFYIAGQHMYGGTNFPSVFNDNDNGSGGTAIQSQQDWAGILAAVMAENNCGFVSSFECINNSVIVGRGAPSAAQLARGMPTLVAVSAAGKAMPYTAGITAITPLPSWVHPDVQKMLLTEVDEVIDLYKEYPAWKGINFLLNTLCGPSYGEVGEDPLAIGYEDVAMARFEKDTGLKCPVAADDPQRFPRRHAWVTGDAKVRAAWVQWRCDVLLALNRQIRDRIQAARPDCKLYLNMAYPYRHVGAEMGEAARDPETLRRYVMKWGWDVRAYQKEPGIVVYTMALADGEKRLMMSGKASEVGLARAQAMHPGYLGLFANDGKGGVDLHNIFTENWPTAQPGKWLWSGNGAWVGYHWATGHSFNDFWTNCLIRANPALVAYNWHDSNLDSRLEPGLRRFAQAWRPLPNGKYETLRGQGRDLNLSIQRCQDHPEYAYLANPVSWPVETVLTFPAGARVTDLNRNRPVKLAADNTWQLELVPYGVQSFRVEGASGQTVLKATTTIGAAAQANLDKSIKAEETLAAHLPKIAVAAAFQAQLAELRAAFNRGDFATAETDLRGGFEYHLARSKALAEKKP